VSGDADVERAPSTSVVLIRHGESVGNSTRTITHHRTCSGLSDEGRAQCELLAKRIDRTGELDGAVLYASHVRRAIETAEFLAPIVGSEIRIDDRFAELDPGPDCDGMTYDDLIANHAPDWTLEDPDGVIYPGGETVAGLHARVAAGLGDVVAKHPGELVVVCTHGGVVDVALRIALKLPVRGWFDLFTLNTSLTGLTDTGRDRWRIDRYNDAAHLLDGFWP
jgi:2,3-bisphosphoglycerate-dependent phosphoglycerate mutase